MAIDMHAHWSPRGLVRETAAGRDWYGWRIFRDHDGREHVSQGQHVLPFAASKSILDAPAERAAARKANEGIEFENLLLTGTFWNYHGAAVPWIENCAFLAAEEKQDILWRNAARFLGLGPDSPFMRHR